MRRRRHDRRRYRIGPVAQCAVEGKYYPAKPAALALGANRGLRRCAAPGRARVAAGGADLPLGSMRDRALHILKPRKAS